MYTPVKKNNVKILYLDIFKNQDNYVNCDDLLDFLNVFCCDSNRKVLFNYNCMEYPEIYTVLNNLNQHFIDYEIRVESIKHIKKINEYNGFCDNVFCKIDPEFITEISRVDIGKNYKLYNFIKTDYEKNLIFDIYLNSKNIVLAKEIIKKISSDGYYSRILFMDWCKNSYYDPYYQTKKPCSYEYEQQIILDNILKDQSFFIYNRKDISKMFRNVMNFYCEASDDLKCIRLDSNFKINICSKIKYPIELNPFDCFDEKGKPKEQLIDNIKSCYHKCCFGCSCEDFIDIV